MKALRAHQQGRNQSGFALATAIAILLVTSMLVTAVIGLTFATLRYSSDQVTRDRETRAAETGVEPAIGVLARATADDARGGDPTTGFILGQVGSPNSTTTGTYDACNWQPAAGEDQANRPSLVQTTVDGQRVEVFCTALQANRYAPVQSSSNRMRVLGKVPAGTWQSTTTSPCLPLSKPECLPWSEALAKAQITGQNAAVATNQTTQTGVRNGTGLVHTGTDPLYVVGNLDVSGGTDVLRNPDRGTGSDYVVDPPGIAVSGSYRQGDPGPLATSGNACGLIAPPPDPAASTVAVTSTTTTVPLTSQQLVPGAQIDDGAAPECDKAALRADVPSATGVAPGPVQTWTLDRIRNEDVTVNRPPRNDGNNAVLPWANYPNSCPVSPNQTVRFQPGAYPANITTLVNKWFAVCAGVKFWFTPGSYWFDANDGAGTSALKMDKTSNLYVFGTPNSGGNTMSTITKATQPMCDPTKAGVNVVLSARTVIRHTAGYAAVCGDPNAANRQAIWQTAAANLGYTSTGPSTIVGGTSNSGWYDGLRNLWLIGSLVNLIFGPGSQFQNTFNMTSIPGGGLQMTASCASAPCNGTAAFSTTWNPPPGQDPGSAIINAATLRITGEESNANDTSFGALPATDIALFKFNPATGTVNTTPCRITSPRINDSEGRQGPHTVDIDLLYPGSPCGTEMDRSDLLKSRIEVAMGLNSGCDLFSTFTGCQYGVTVNSIRLETPQVLAPPAESAPVFVGSASSATQTNPQSVLAADGNSARFRSDSACQVRVWLLGCVLWRASDTMSGTVRLPSITDRYAPALADGYLSTSPADAELQSASVRIKGISSCDRIGSSCVNAAVANSSPSQVRVTVRNSAGGAVCDATFQRLPEWNQTRSYDLLNNCLSGGVKKLRYNRDLLNTSLDVRFEMVRDKNLISGCRAGPVFDPTSVIRNCASWTYDVDYIGVSTTVSLPANQKFDGPTREFLVTSNDLPNVNQEGRFNVYGTVILPRADMRVDWIGPANHIGDPIVTGPPRIGDGTTVVDSLVVGSLQSYMSRFSGENPNSAVDDPRAGIICCDQGRQAERLVELRSHVIPTTSISLPKLGGTTGSTTTTSTSSTTSTPGSTTTTAPPIAWTAAQQVLTNCNNDNPVNLTPPASVGASQAAAWRAQVITDWKQECRTDTLRAVTTVRFLDQVPANIAATSPYAAQRGAWLPGFDVEVQGWRFCKGGVLTAGALACAVT